uniref:BTB domain-containing protein n=1 Tax=Panagrellus redivivus TaxID=6233 RepID=A0A7E4ZQK5_PANRE
MDQTMGRIRERNSYIHPLQAVISIETDRQRRPPLHACIPHPPGCAIAQSCRLSLQPSGGLIFAPSRSWPEGRRHHHSREEAVIGQRVFMFIVGGACIQQALMSVWNTRGQKDRKTRACKTCPSGPLQKELQDGDRRSLVATVAKNKPTDQIPPRTPLVSSDEKQRCLKATPEGQVKSGTGTTGAVISDKTHSRSSAREAGTTIDPGRCTDSDGSDVRKAQRGKHGISAGNRCFPGSLGHPLDIVEKVMNKQPRQIAIFRKIIQHRFLAFKASIDTIDRLYTMEFHDVAELKVSTDYFENLPDGGCVKSSERPIDGSKRLRWAFHLVKWNRDFFRTDLWVSSTDSVLKAVGELEVGPLRPQYSDFNVHLGQGDSVKTIHEGLYCNRLGANGLVKVDVTFSGYEEELKRFRKPRLPAFTINDFIESSNHCSSDARIVVGKDTLEVHRHVLCIVSPVFDAAFTHDTKEAKTGTIIIKDFDFTTVKNVIDTCYGRECAVDSLADFIDMLRFADKYDIRSIIKTIEPFLDLSIESLCVIAKYAWDLEKTDLKLKCAKFYKENHANITFLPEFVNMDSNIIVDIIRLGASID